MTYLNQIFYEEKGQGNEAILFIHGLASKSSDWEKQVNFFSKNFRVITVDLRGHGKSKKTPPFTISSFAADLIALIKHLKIAHPHLVGVSLGGMIACQIAVDEPDLPKSLTIVNSLPELVLTKFRHKWKFYSRIFLVKIFGMKITGKILAKNLFPNKDQQKLRDEFAQDFAKNDKTSYLSTFLSALGWSVVDKLHLIKCKTLFLTADNDYTPLSAKEFFAKKIGAKLVEIKNAGHALPAEKPDEFNAALTNFLSE